MISDTARSLLTELANLLDALPRSRFDYGRWVGSGWKGAPDLSCGTVACAAGWATTLPSFRTRGLSLDVLPSRWNPGALEGCPTMYDGSGPTLWGTAALAEVLQISYDDACYLFLPDVGRPARDWPRSPDISASSQEVAAHIRQYLFLAPKEAT